MNLDPSNLSKAREAVLKFRSDDYPEMVKNPILLLNYFYLHSFIRRPEFTVVFEKQNPPYFIVSCSVNEERAMGTGSSKKAARVQAAEKMLNMILKSADNVIDTDLTRKILQIDCDSENSVILTEIPTKKTENQIVSDSNGEKLASYNTYVHMFSSKLQPYSPSAVIEAQPQCGNEELLGDNSSLKRMLSSPTNSYSEENCTQIITCETDSIKNEDQRTNSTHKNLMSLDDYFDPYYNVRKTLSQESSASSSNSDIENIKPNVDATCHNNGEDDKVVVTEAPQVKPSAKSKNDRRRREAKRAKLSGHDYSYIFDSHFDPFLKLKPVSLNKVEQSYGIKVAKVGDVNVETENPKEEKSESTEPDVIMLEKTKSPFAILQEKSIKNLKMIPRSTIDRCEEGFRCKLVLDAYSSEGVGQSKKLAKINAAIDLLNQLEELS